MIKILNFFSRVIGLLIGRYKNATNFQSLLIPFCKQADDMETAMFEVRDLFWLDTAVGKQLDTIGDVLNADRDGRDDAEYRLHIKDTIQIFNSGTPEQIISALKVVYGITGNLIYNPEYPGSFFIYDDYSFGLNNDVLEPLSPAGVLGFFGTPIAQGDTDLDEPWLVDAYGEEICYVRRDNPALLTDEFGNILVDDFGNEITED